MKIEEAVRLCEFWTVTESGAIGSTSNSEVGEFFGGEEFPYEQFSNPKGRKGWAVRVPRRVNDGPFVVENHAFKMIEQEIERRAAQQEA